MERPSSGKAAPGSLFGLCQALLPAASCRSLTTILERFRHPVSDARDTRWREGLIPPDGDCRNPLPPVALPVLQFDFYEHDYARRKARDQVLGTSGSRIRLSSLEL